MQVTDRIGLPNIQSVCQKLFEEYKVRTLLDLGGGGNPLAELCNTLGIHRLNVDLAEPESSTFQTRTVNLNITDFDSIEMALLEFFGNIKIDAVIMIQSIEHLTKDDGLKVLEKLDSWASKLIIVETPNGFVFQGPLDSNPWQEHLSGWEKRDFTSAGFEVRGTQGLKILKQDRSKGAYRFRFRGLRFIDVLLSRMLFTSRFPSLSYNCCAVKIITRQ